MDAVMTDIADMLAWVFDETLPNFIIWIICFNNSSFRFAIRYTGEI